MPEYLERNNNINTKAALEEKYDAAVREILLGAELPFQINKTTKIKYFICGSRSIAVKIKDYIFRFPTSKEVWESYQNDCKTLAFIRDNVSKIWHNKLPDVKIVSLRGKKADKYYKRFSYYKIIKGKTLDPRYNIEDNINYLSLDEKSKEALAKGLAVFLAELHGISPEKIKNEIVLIDKIWGYDYNSNFDYDKSRENLLKFSDGKLDLKNYITDFDKDNLVLSHNDLVGSNILIDENSKDVLKGIVDFGEVNLSSRYNDFFCLCRIDRELARQTIQYYNKESAVKVKQKALDYQYLCWLSNSMAPYYDSENKTEDLVSTYEFFEKHFLEPFLHDLESHS